MIQYGITQWALPGEGIYAIRHVAEMGFDGMQLEVGAYAKGYYMSQKSIRDAYLEDGEKYGIQFPSIVLNDLMVNGFVKPRGSEQYKIAQETMELGLEIAKYMKIDDVMIPQFWGNEITDDETFEQTVEELGRFCKKAAAAGIHVESETTLTAERQIELFERIGAQNLTCFYDTQNYYYFSNYDQLEVLKKLYPHMGRQLHVKDCNGHDYDGGVLAGAMLGDGECNFRSVMDYLGSRGYEGWLIMENNYWETTIRAHYPNQFDAVRFDLEKLKKMVSLW